MFHVISIILSKKLFFSNFPNFQSRKIAFRTLLPNFQSGEIAFRTLLPNFQSREIAFRTLLTPTDSMTCDHVTVLNRVTVTGHRGPISNRGPKIFKMKKISKFF